MTRISTEHEAFVGPIDAPQAADVLAERVRTLVLDGVLHEGDVLPAERSLMADTGLGRATVREALRILEVESLIEPRLGRYGGWTVRRPDPATVVRSIDGFIRGAGVRFTDLLATREAIEPSCAALAAEHRTDADLADLEESADRLRACVGDLPLYLRENVRWHLAVVAATHNELLIAIMSALGDAIHEGTDIEHFNSLRVRRAAIAAHDAVAAAIRDGDADAARRRMHRHVHAFRDQATRHATRRGRRTG
jgi:GntR family transcriptional regulator, transcriptional repressor for pyruvate dehydrogenase complex